MTREEIMQLNTDYLNGRESEHKMNELFNYVLELQKHEQQPVEMTAEEYRKRMIQAFHNAGTGELVALCVLPTEKEFEHLEWLLKNNYKKEPCEDCISRKAVLDAMYNLCGEGALENNPWRDNPHIDAIVDAILDLSPVTPQPKTGHWITTRTFMYDGEFYCDKCRCDSPNNEKWDYCPNCGKRMQQE